MRINHTFNDAFAEFYCDNPPEYVLKAGKTYLVVMAGADWQGGPKKHRITIKDVVEYYHTEARNITSGCRTLADIIGDWRPIDHLANECLQWFKHINRESLAREGRKHGMTLR